MTPINDNPELDKDGLDASELRADGGSIEAGPWYEQYLELQKVNNEKTLQRL